MKTIKNQKGITLIALIITIIVLLILAGIAIAALAGDNGIITQARNAKNKHNEGQADEEQKLGDIYDLIGDIETESKNDLNDMQVSAGSVHAVVLMKDGTIKVCGWNDDGQLGLGDYANRYEFITVPGINEVKQVSTGGNSTILLMSDGTIKVCGGNWGGQLGIEDNNINTFKTVPGISGVKQVSTGDGHTVLLMNDGTIKVCGWNDCGQLGLGGDYDNYKYDEWGYSYKDKFTTVSGISEVKEVLARAAHTVILMNDGTIKVCGRNESEQLGLGDDYDNYKYDEWDYPYIDKFTTVSGISGVKEVSTGYYHTVLLMENGTIKVCGSNGDGQLGIGEDHGIRGEFITVSGISGVKQVSAGEEHTILLINDGTVRTCGSNWYEQLGIKGSNKNTFTEVSKVSGVKQVSGGGIFTILLMNDETVELFGSLFAPMPE